MAEGVRRAIDAWGLRLCAKEPKWHSDTVSAIMVPEGFNGNEVAKLAYLRYGLSLGVGLSKVAGKLFRIGHLGDLNELMLLTVLAGSEMAMRDIGMREDMVGGASKNSKASPSVPPLVGPALAGVVAAAFGKRAGALDACIDFRSCTPTTSTRTLTAHTRACAAQRAMVQRVRIHYI